MANNNHTKVTAEPDKQELAITAAARSWKKDLRKLVSFLDRLPRGALRYAIEHLDKEQRDHYLGMKKAG